jgi:hypothetical protein
MTVRPHTLRCHACSYDLSGLPETGVCPECSAAIAGLFAVRKPLGVLTRIGMACAASSIVLGVGLEVSVRVGAWSRFGMYALSTASSVFRDVQWLSAVAGVLCAVVGLLRCPRGGWREWYAVGAVGAGTLALLGAILEPLHGG